MSEELGREHAGAGRPIEPVTSSSSSPVATSAHKRTWEGSAKKASDSSSRPGGGSKLSQADQPGDPYATLIVLDLAGLVPKKLYSAPRPLPASIDEGLGRVAQSVLANERSVVVVSGGSAGPQACMQELVLRLPGGLDSFGRGRKVEVLVKEAASEHGNLWESALLVKMVAKRQAALVRFGTVVVVTGRRHAAATERVYRKVFEDWRTLQDGGLGHGGRDLPLDVHVQPIEVECEVLAARAAELDDGWYAKGLVTYGKHPSWPRLERPAGGGTDGDAPSGKQARQGRLP